MSTLDAIVKLELTSMRAALGEEEHKLARCGSSGATWRSDVSMREKAERAGHKSSAHHGEVEAALPEHKTSWNICNPGMDKVKR